MAFSASITNSTLMNSNEGSDKVENEEIFTIPNDDGIDAEEEDDIVCAICLDGNSYEENMIIFCDKCDVPVHRCCYGVQVIPEGSWYCDACSKGLHPQYLSCELCGNGKGALKPTETKGKWVHALCAMWIPEVFCPDPNTLNRFVLTNIDQKRFKLKCAICATTKKGACIQCAYGKCSKSAHPSCALNPSSGFTHRIIKSEDVLGACDWEIFCVQHATSVKDALKPKCKSKRLHSLEEGPGQSNDNFTSSSLSESSVADHNKNNKKIGGKGPRGKGPKSDNSVVKTPGRRGRPPRPRPTQEEVFVDSDDDDTNTVGGGSTYDEMSTTGSTSHIFDSSRAMPGINSNGCGDSTSNGNAIHSLLEWPGQLLGEAMDLQHFWKVASMMHPEDHSQQWLDFMTEPLLAMHNDESFLAIPPLGPGDNDVKHISANLDELLVSLGGDRERSAIFDSEKRQQFLEGVLLNASGMFPSEAEAETATSGELGELKSALRRAGPVIGSLRNGLLSDEYLFSEQIDFHRSARSGEPSDSHTSNGAGRLAATVSALDEEDGCISLRLAVDGRLHRGYVDFRLTSSAASKAKTDVDIDVVTVGPATETERMFCATEVWPKQPKVPYEQASVDSETLLEVEVEDTGLLPDSQSVLVGDSLIIPKDQEDEISSLIRTDAAVYRYLCEAIRHKLEHLAKHAGIRENTERVEAQKKQWAAVEERYSLQRTWKRVAVLLIQGLRDQLPDFNKEEPEAVPASWAIPVDGRPKPVVDTTKDKWGKEKGSSKEKSKEHEDDLVCACCFTGNSLPGNEILFCDGCNSPVHQFCYGVVDIPEGNFFCNRCRHIQMLADEQLRITGLSEPFLGNIRDVIKCCLCPLYHGGLKPTTDGRWVHLCCAWLSCKAVVTNLTEMEPVDISQVPVVWSDAVDHLYRSGRRQRRRTGGESFGRSNVSFTGSDGSCIGNTLTSPNDLSSTTLLLQPLPIPSMQMNYLTNAVENVTIEPRSDISNSDSQQLNLYSETVTLQADSVTDMTLPTIPMLPEPAYCCFCDERMGFLVTCCGSTHCHTNYATSSTTTGCDVHFHPLCAWFEGLYVRTENSDESFCEFLDKRDIPGVPYPSYGISFSFYCSNHCPAEVTGPTRAAQTLLRGKYRVSVEDWDIIPGYQRHKKKKKRKAFQSSAGAGTSDGRDSLSSSRVASGSTAQIKDLDVDIYDSTVCAACIQPVASVFKVITAAPESRMCSTCGIVLHVSCYPGCPPCQMHQAPTIAVQNDSAAIVETVSGDTSSSVPASTWICGTCAVGSTDTRCAFCPRRGGSFLPTDDGRWAHVLCGVYAPGMTRVSPEGRVEIRSIAKELKRQNCIICNRRTGVFMKCSHNECASYFHATCAQLSQKCYLTKRRGLAKAYCESHIPQNVTRLPSGHWIDGNEIGAFRTNLEHARLIIDLIRLREKKKIAFYRACGEAFQASVAYLTRKNSHCESPALTADDDELLFGDSMNNLHDNDDALDGFRYDSRVQQSQSQSQSQLQQLAKKRGRKPKLSFNLDTSFMTDKELDDILEQNYDNSSGATSIEGKEGKKAEGRGRKPIKVKNIAIELDEHTDYTDEYLPLPPKRTPKIKVKRLPKNLFVLLSGQEVGKHNIIDVNEKDFKRKLVNDIKKTVKDSRKDSGLFKNHSQFVEFESTLDPHFDMYLSMTTKKAISTYMKQLEAAEMVEEVVANEPEPVTEPVTEIVTASAAIQKRGRGRTKKEIVLEDEVFVEQTAVTPAAPIPPVTVTEPKASGRRGSRGQFTAVVKDEPAVEPAVATELLSPPKRPYTKREKHPAAEVQLEVTEPGTRSAAGRKRRFTELTEAAEDPLTRALCVAFDSVVTANNGFQDIVNEVLSSQENLSTSDLEDWEIIPYSDTKRRLQLEGRIADIIKYLEDTEDAPGNSGKSSSRSSGQRKLTRSQAKMTDFLQLEAGTASTNSGNETSKKSMALAETDKSKPKAPRRLAEFFLEDTPVTGWETLVNRYIVVADLLENNRAHRYQSMATFKEDLFEMLNNGRILSAPGSQVWKDTTKIVKALESYERHACPLFHAHELTSSSSTSSGGGVGQTDVSYEYSGLCCRCAKQYYLEGWPFVAPDSDLKKRKSARIVHSQSEGRLVWTWCCPACGVHPASSLDLIGRRALVWWDGDTRYYEGVLADFEPVSQRHLVEYSDGEWEFVRLDEVPCVLEFVAGDVSGGGVLSREEVASQQQQQSHGPHSGKKSKNLHNEADVAGESANTASGRSNGVKAAAETDVLQTNAPDYKPIPRKRKVEREEVTSLPDAASSSSRKSLHRTSKDLVAISADEKPVEPVITSSRPTRSSLGALSGNNSIRR